MTRLVFLGDIGIDRPVSTGAALPSFSDADLVVGNLEGAILSDDARAGLRRRRRVAVHNAPEVVDLLETLGVGAVGLANNHVFDYDAPIGSTRRVLDRAGIGSFGAGADLAEAAAPCRFEGEDGRILLFAFGWEMIGCRPADRSRAGVNPLRPDHALEVARRARREDPDALIVFQMHWNYELELYPQPAHRQLAHDLVAAGVDAVIGGHPHVAEGVELMDGRPVCYSLGNWLFPPRDIDGFAVAYPPVARRQLAVELEVEGRTVLDVRLRWYRFDPARSRIEPESVESIPPADGGTLRPAAAGSPDVSGPGEEAPIATSLTPYAGLSHEAYVEWFRSHRTRSRGLPLYADYGASTNAGRDAYLRLRQGAGEVLARLGLKREQRGRPQGAAPSTRTLEAEHGS
jgi:poly-gamma-glutamate synthesis protein (capsule biosynthesis protein)